MAFDNLGLAGLANIAVRTLQHEIRQATSSAISSATSSPDPTLASSTGLPSSTTPFEGPTSTAPPDNGNTNTNGNGNGNGSGQGSSPLLFFVALGFGVVFTNLWIIVGVKYCFRYNARNRNIRMTGEDGEPINLENMPQHPRRRRREKKLMTMDEVNEKFPMMKYKNWVASRAQEGLPTRGGISQPPSRANSIRDADGIIPTIKERESTEDRPATSGTSIIRETTREPTTEHAEKTAPTSTVDGDAPSTSPGTANATTAPARTDSPASDDDHYEDEDDQIHDALPPEALESSGDTCAICIDTLEDDDDVRGLTCGHAFHAVCLDPWLTSRRACCPLCKADYYTPKPRQPQPEGVEGTQVGPTVSIAQDPRTARANMPSRPGVAWIFSGRRGRMGLPGRNRDNGSTQPQTQSRSNNNGRRQRQQQQQSQQQQRTGFFSRSNTQPTSRPTPAAADNATTTQTTEARSGGFLSSIRQQLPSFGRSNATQDQSTANTQVTPSALEAGTRADAAR